MYDRHAVVFNDPSGFAGGASVRGGPTATFASVFNWQIVTHEFGHTFGFTHAGSWVPLVPDPLGVPGTAFDTGDPVDRMGFGNKLVNHYNAFFKQYAGWLTTRDWTDVTHSGLYRVYAHDTTFLGIRALRIAGGPSRRYWIDLRRRLDEPWSLAAGAEIRYEIPPPMPTWSYSHVRLLDMVPATRTLDDHALLPGMTFEDREYRVRVTALASSADADGQYMDLLVELGF